MGHSLPCISWQQDFYRVGLLTPRSTPNLDDQASVFVTSGDRVTHLYPQTLGTDFSHLLRHPWATLGLLLSSGHGLLLEVSVHVNVCDFEIVGFCPREILSEICKDFQFVNTTNVINYILGRL
jgi:hypothetical protein